MHFDTVEDAQTWLASKPYSVYTHDGLVVDFRKNHGAGGTLSVDVWQILIRKQRPEMLKGSHDELISVSRRTAHRSAYTTHPCRSAFAADAASSNSFSIAVVCNCVLNS
jgi:hypothetical protein